MKIRKQLGKKAIMFSIIAVTLSGLFVILFSSKFEAKVDNRNTIIQTRITELDRVIEQTENFIIAASDEAGTAALDALYVEVNNTGTFLTDFSTEFPECMLNSTGCSNTMTLQELVDEFEEDIMEIKNTQVNITINEIIYTPTREGPWNIDLDINFTIFINDSYATWNLSRVTRGTVNTIGVYDPAMIEIENTYGHTGAQMEERRIIPNYDKYRDIEWNTSIVLDIYYGKEYWMVITGNEDASCLSDRFEGNFNNINREYCAIETFIRRDEHAFDNYIPIIDSFVLQGTTIPGEEMVEVNNIPDITLREVDVVTMDFLLPTTPLP